MAGRVQLAITGTQDVFFTENPEYTHFIKQFKDSIIKIEGIRSHKELAVIKSTDKILRHRLFFNKYRYIFTTFNPNTKLVSKMKKIIHNADARLSIDRDRWKHTIYLGSKKDVAKLQLTIGTKGYLKKVVLTDEL